jgi:hypothetical protein
MASRLKAIVPKAAVPSKPQMLVYGKPGVGKTWVALDFPGVFYIDTERGCWPRAVCISAPTRAARPSRSSSTR